VILSPTLIKIFHRNNSTSDEFKNSTKTLAIGIGQPDKGNKFQSNQQYARNRYQSWWLLHVRSRHWDRIEALAPLADPNRRSGMTSRSSIHTVGNRQVYEVFELWAAYSCPPICMAYFRSLYQFSQKLFWNHLPATLPKPSRLAIFSSIDMIERWVAQVILSRQYLSC